MDYAELWAPIFQNQGSFSACLIFEMKLVNPVLHFWHKQLIILDCGKNLKKSIDWKI